MKSSLERTSLDHKGAEPHLSCKAPNPHEISMGNSVQPINLTNTCLQWQKTGQSRVEVKASILKIKRE